MSSCSCSDDNIRIERETTEWSQYIDTLKHVFQWETEFLHTLGSVTVLVDLPLVKLNKGDLIGRIEFDSKRVYAHFKRPFTHEMETVDRSYFLLQSTSETGLSDITARRIGDISTEVFKKLKAAKTTVTSTGATFKRVTTGTAMTDATVALLTEHDLPGPINPATAWILPNENHRDVLIVTFDEKSKDGLIVIEDKGIWSVSGSTYAWRGIQDLDIVMGFRDDGSLQLDSLK
jgi:hypothetical protein